MHPPGVKLVGLVSAYYRITIISYRFIDTLYAYFHIHTRSWDMLADDVYETV